MAVLEEVHNTSFTIPWYAIAISTTLLILEEVLQNAMEMEILKYTKAVLTAVLPYTGRKKSHFMEASYKSAQAWIPGWALISMIFFFK